MIIEYKTVTTVENILDELEDGVTYIIYIIGYQYHLKWVICGNTYMAYHCDYYGHGTQEEFNKIMQMVVKTKMYKPFKNEDDELQEGIEMSIFLK